MGKITYIDEADIKNNKILLRVDFNISLTDQNAIADDTRIRQALPTIKYLLERKNRLVIVSHFGRPKTRDSQFSMKIIADYLKNFLSGYRIGLIDDFLTDDGKNQIKNQQENEVLMLENIRFYPQEKKNDPDFAKTLASLADVYVNDAFGVCHRNDASVVGPPQFIPSFGGLLLKKEITTIGNALKNPGKPFAVVIGGAKISTKISLINKFIEIADYILIGGGLANTFIYSQGHDIGGSFCECQEADKAKQMLLSASQKNTTIILPEDVAVLASGDGKKTKKIKKVDEIAKDESILDIGPETRTRFGSVIARAKTIVWNGPVGYFENPEFREGTDFVYEAIVKNEGAVSIVGGGDTLAAISKKEHLDKITHISTGGGAMLELIEKGTLPGIEALKK